ncbi:MAG: Ig-like domain-containing protein [Erysipelotrichaceae bacterium]|nr:Ig-like domain-containing protein [Erysipelotrichaceae bacterium]
MKRCTACSNLINDDAQFCSYCGAAVQNTASQRQTTAWANRNAKPKTKWEIAGWIIGFLFFFPIPVTLLMLRNRRIKKNIRYGIMAATWILFTVMALAPSKASGCQINKIQLAASSTMEVEVGQSNSDGYVTVYMKSDEPLNPEDMKFVSDTDAIATIAYAGMEGENNVRFAVNGVREGKTRVYVENARGTVRSNPVTVNVVDSPKPESIQLKNYSEQLAPGETTQAVVSIRPTTVKNESLTWSSSDEAVATVNAEGMVTAVADGTAEITASASNGVAASYTVEVVSPRIRMAGEPALMNVRVSRSIIKDGRIGSELSDTNLVNGIRVPGEVTLTPGEVLELYAQIREADDIPDVGENSTIYSVTEEDLVNGFTVSFNVDVSENGTARYSTFAVTYTFTPAE